MLKFVMLFCLLGILFTSGHTQDLKAVETLKKKLAAAKTPGDKVYFMDNLSRVLMNVDLQQAEELGKQIILVAEESRDRELMVKAYISNGQRCSYFGGRGDYTERSIQYYEKALDIARQNKLHDWTGAAQLRLAGVYLLKLDKDKALNLANEAASVLALSENDSLKAESDNMLGKVYLARNNKTLSLRKFLQAFTQAEDINNDALIRDCYLNLSGFYSNIGDYERAIDYYTRALNKLDDLHEGNETYQRAIYMTAIGNLYGQQGKEDIALHYYEQSIALGDSLKFPTLKVPAYIGILNQFLRMDKPAKALEYFNSARGAGLKEYLSKFGFSGVLDQAYAVIYTGTGKLDSARIYFERARGYFEQNTNDGIRISFYGGWAGYFEKAGDRKEAINKYLMVKDLAEKNGLLEMLTLAAQRLDTLYAQSGDFKQSRYYNGIYYQYKDSVDKLNKEKELAQVEATDEQQRQVKLEKQQEEDERRRHNIQYMGITIGIAAFFVLLVFMGIFKVSESTIKVLGFFAFIMFFEFVILIADNKIHHYTHGEPWKVLAIKIVLIAGE
ncbi:MAG: tetratricopeptide repeat protein [Chitinophagaceae bacterium]|nr:tetratricopeptide repeat protein [Chitinophagaceae bacterium]